MNTLKPRRGKLFLIGGAARACFKKFFDLAGGHSSRILLVPHASEDWKENGDALALELREMGAARVDVAIPSQPFAIPRGTTGIYMLGGDQVVLVKLLGERGKRALHRYHRRGGLIAGSSAGAAGQSRLMIAEGMADKQLVDGSLVTACGLALLKNVVIDTHFMQRNRYNRLMVAQFLGKAGVVGVGLDEDTGILVDSNIATVYGAGAANFFVPQNVFKAKHAQPEGEPKRLSVGNVLVSFLNQGCAFDFETLEPSEV
ncbi:MAG: cyanophycinase [Candidatus Melainabacteria bacterium]|nr:cyanophycinase [Candidatus Melainabacteria bacterium]